MFGLKSLKEKLLDWITLLLALAAGAVVTIQAGSNAQLKQSLGSPILRVGRQLCSRIRGNCQRRLGSSITCTHNRYNGANSLVGMGRRATRITIRPSGCIASDTKWGAATLIATVVTGQLICSVVLDHFAWMGFELHRVSLLRVTGCVLMVAGLALIAKF